MNERQSVAERVSVILVLFNSAETIEAAINSVPAGAEVVAVDQCSHDDGVLRVLRARPSCKVIRADENRGFGAGCNLGAANTNRDFLVFLNPDSELEPGAVELLAARLDDPRVGVAGPQIFSKTGEWRTEARNAGGVWKDALNLLVPREILPYAWKQDIPASDPRYDHGGEVTYVQGACMAIRRGEFDAVGGFDADFFLYSEEEWLSARLRQRGLTTVIVPDARLRHAGKASTFPTGLFAIEQHFRSRVVFYDKSGGLANRWLGAVLLTCAIALLRVSSGFRRSRGIRREATPEWCAAALRGVHAGVVKRRVTAP